MISQQDSTTRRRASPTPRRRSGRRRRSSDRPTLNLSYTQIRSPIDGVAGLALVRVGNLVGQDGPTLLTTVSQIDPIRVNFPLSEVDYVRYPERFEHLEKRDLAWAQEAVRRGSTRGGTAEGGDPGVELVLADGSVYPHRGVIVAANRQIDASTGTIQVQALVAEPRRRPAPGPVRARAHPPRRGAGHDVIVVPEKALISVQGTYSVGVVGPGQQGAAAQGRARARASRACASSRAGVAEGDRIVVDGVQKDQRRRRWSTRRPAPDAARRARGRRAPRPLRARRH